MDEIELYKSIQNDLLKQGVDISDEVLSSLYTNTITCLNDILEDGNILDISGIGSFSRRKGITSSLSFFKPTDKQSD